MGSHIARKLKDSSGTIHLKLNKAFKKSVVMNITLPTLLCCAPIKW